MSKMSHTCYISRDECLIVPSFLFKAKDLIRFRELIFPAKYDGGRANYRIPITELPRVLRRTAMYGYGINLDRYTLDRLRQIETQ